MHTPACLISANPPSLLIGFAHTFGVVSHSNMLVRVVWHRDQLLRVLERAVQPADHPRYSQQTSPTSPTSPTPPRLALSDMCVNSGSNNAPTLQYVLTVQRKKLVWVLILWTHLCASAVPGQAGRRQDRCQQQGSVGDKVLRSHTQHLYTLYMF